MRRPEPRRQRQFRPMHRSAGGERGLPSAIEAFQQARTALQGHSAAPAALQSRFLNDDHFDLRATALLGLRPRPRKKVDEAAAVSTRDHMLGKLLAAQAVDRHDPFRFAQFQRGEQRGIFRAGGGHDNGRAGDRSHRLPPCWCGSSAYQVGPPSTRMGSVIVLFVSLLTCSCRTSGSSQIRLKIVVFFAESSV